MKISCKSIELATRGPAPIAHSKAGAEAPPEALFDELLAGLGVEQTPRPVPPPVVHTEATFETDGLIFPPTPFLLRGGPANVAQAPVAPCRLPERLPEPSVQRVSGPPGPLRKPNESEVTPKAATPVLLASMDDMIVSTPRHIFELSKPFAPELGLELEPVTECLEAQDLSPDVAPPVQPPVTSAEAPELTPAAPNLPTPTRVQEMAEPMANSAAMLAVRLQQDQRTSVSMSHPQLGNVALEMHTKEGCLEVTAVLQTDAAATIVKSHEHGMRKGVERGGLAFSGLKVRVDDEGDEPSSRAPKRARKSRAKRE